MAKSPSGKTPAPSQAPDTTNQPAAQKQGAAGKPVHSTEFLLDVARERVSIIIDGLVPHGIERDLVRAFIECHQAGCFDDRLPMESNTDTLVTEHALKYGRADVVLFHTDGTATVIEAKDGSKGYGHVVSGIGQCSLYAAQIAAKHGVVKAIQRALMWTSVGNLAADGAIEDACELAGVIPMPYPSIEMLMATRCAATSLMRRILSTQEVDDGRP